MHPSFKQKKTISSLCCIFFTAAEFKFKFHFKDVKKIQFKKFNQNKVTAQIVVR